jgi:hypothetical protein
MLPPSFGLAAWRRGFDLVLDARFEPERPGGLRIAADGPRVKVAAEPES